jgi:flagellin-like hook-associated protein FlgL
MSISKSQSDNLLNKSLGKTDYSIEDTANLDLTNPTLALFFSYTKIFTDEIELQIRGKNIRGKDITASGELGKNIDLVANDDGTGVYITMLDYYDFVNKGVKGVKSSKNAPNSPYQYKTYKMPKSARKGLREYINRGKASIAVVNTKKTTIGAEKKRVSLIDAQVNQLVYNIKKYGIKTTNYLDNAMAIVLPKLSEDMLILIGRAIVVQIGQPKKKK